MPTAALLRGARRLHVDGRTHAKRINHERVDEALPPDATAIATACPFCRVMVTRRCERLRQEEAGCSGVEVPTWPRCYFGSLDHDKGAAHPVRWPPNRFGERAPKAAPKAAAP